MFLFNMWTWYGRMWSMPIDKTKCCKIHTEEKEKSGECCQLDEQQDAEQATYEYTVNLNEEKHE